MSAALPNNERRVIPRWRDLRLTHFLGELGAVGGPPARSWQLRTEGLATRIRDWDKHRSRSFATDLVGSAIVMDAPECARDAARFLIEDGDLRGSTRMAVEAIVAGTLSTATNDALDQAPLDAQMREARARIRRDPRNSLRWSEVARIHTINGRLEQADRAIRISVALAPGSRYVVRSAVRFFIHRHKADLAHDLLLRCTSLRSDPWLVAAEISAASLAERRSSLIPLGKHMVKSGDFSPHAVTELASALATVELGAGHEREARRLFHRALVDPTDNVIAQVEWASDQMRGLELGAVVMGQHFSWEARAKAASSRGNWRGAISEARGWLDDQPFSSGPAILGSYHAAMGGEFDAGIEFCQRGLSSNHDKPMLLNNAAFCMLSAGQLNRARPYVQKLHAHRSDPEWRPFVLAIEGLEAYRSGEAQRGRSLYKAAMSSTRDPDLRARAAAVSAREERLAGLAEAEAALALANQLARGARRPHEIELWAGSPS